MPLDPQAHPGNDYYVFLPTGTIQRQGNALAAAALMDAGWQGPYTWAQAKQVANLSAKLTSPPGTPPPAAAPGGPKGLAAIGDFFARLSQASTWIRVGEVFLGLILLAVGVARITNTVPIATKVARTAGAVALA